MSPRLPAAAVPALLRVSIALALTGCVAAPPNETLGVECSGKCDGVGEQLESAWKDIREVDLGDLVNVGAGFATDELNDALAFDNASIELQAPELYALAEDAEGDLTLNDLDALSTGLLERYGERELSAEVNEARRAHLRASSDVVFAESAFTIGANLDPSWRFEAPGLGAGGFATVGFSAGGQLESRVIGAFDSEASATGGSVLASLREGRGFVLPRSVEDLSAMKPGESFALSGSGALGINVGAGVPIVLGETGAIGYNLVFSASLRTWIEGDLDVQLVRLEGDQVVLDVGTLRARNRHTRLAIEDGFGVAGLVDQTVQLAGHAVDLGDVAESALERGLNDRLNLIEGSVERTGRSSRVSVARFRFSLDSLDEAGAQALAQALRGDVRLAQALSAQEAPGVVAEMDVLRSGVSATSTAGLDLLGMRFFRESIEQSGTTVIQTPGGVRTVMFDRLREEGGWFFSSHGYGRVGLSGLVFDPSAPGRAQGEANLFVEIVEGDDFMERDKMIDHLDAFITALAGPAALAALEADGNALEQRVEAICDPSGGPDSCREEALEEPTVVSLRASAQQSFAAAIGDLDAPTRDALLAAAELRITQQVTLEPAASLVGPQAAVTLSYRLDDGALEALLTDRSGADLSAAIGDYLAAIDVDRGDDASRIASDRAELRQSDSAAMAARFDAAADRYGSLVALSHSRIEGLGAIGAEAIEIRLPVDAQSGPRYADAGARSVARARMDLLTELFDELLLDAEAFGRHPEQLVAYALLSLVDESRLDVRLDVDMDLGNRFAQDYDHYRAAGMAPIGVYVRGSRSADIDGGLFDIDALTSVD